MLAGVCFGLLSGQIEAGESHEQVREGLRHYQAAEYDSAQKLFATATEELDKSRSSQAAISAFDEACALHRKGDKEKARERYLKAGLSPDKTISTASHFNLGTLSAENARSIAGTYPENVAAEDRQKILDELKQAVASYRHALELNPEHQPSRRNLELVRTWIKYYSDRWNEIDRQKRRDESDLIQFLEFLMMTQTALKQSVQQLPQNASLDVYAQLKKNQDELAEELPFLREKIAKELQPQSTPSGPGASSQPLPPELKQGIELLQSWSDKAADEMQAASSQLFKAKPADAVAHQQGAVAQLDQIWDAVIPFHPLLAKELDEQTAIAEQLSLHETTASAAPEDSPSDAPALPDGFVPISPAADPTTSSVASEKAAEATTAAEKIKSNNPKAASTPLPSDVILDESALLRLMEQQSTALRKARLLAPKAQAELSRLEANPAEAVAAEPVAAEPVLGASPDATVADQNAAPRVDPEKLKQGLQKAVELSPKAVESMQLAVDHLQRKDSKLAAAPAEEARRILEEIQNAQPEQPQQDQNKEDQEEQDQKKQKEQKKDDQSQKNDDQQEQNEKKDDDKKSSEQKQDSKDQKSQDKNKQGEKNQEQKKQSDQKKDDKQKQDQDKSDNKSGDSKDKSQSSESNSEKPQVSHDRIEDALRKVRERQQEKRERDREMRARIIGRTPVEKDW